MSRKLAAAALICGIAGLPLLLLSYGWVPFAVVGREPESVWYAVLVGEVGALAAGAVAVGLGIAVRRRTSPAQPERRVATRGLAMGAAVLALVLIPNVVGSLWTAR